MCFHPTKSIFGVTTSKLIGHIVSNSDINIDQKIVIVIQNLLGSTSKK